MSALWGRGAAGQRCALIVYDVNGQMAPRQTDFIGAGAVFISHGLDLDLRAARGTMTNMRRPLPWPPPVEVLMIQEASQGTNGLRMAGHGFELGDGPIVFTGNACPDGMSLDTPYWIVPIDADWFAIAASLEDAYAGNIVDFEDDTVNDLAPALGSIPATRGLDGLFWYTCAKGEVDPLPPEIVVIVDGQVEVLIDPIEETTETRDFRRAYGAGAVTSVGRIVASVPIVG